MKNTLIYLLSHKYLSEDQLNGLKNYVYNAVDSSPLSQYVLHPFWNYVVQFMPLTFAPNLMTFLGFNFLLFGCMVIAFIDPHFTIYANPVAYENHCSLLWIFLMIVQFISHTLDGIDGKQARRLKCSSALGELFDHGLDSWACGMFPLPFFSVISSSPPWGLHPLRMHFLLWLIYFSFFLSHWEKYNTGVLYLPWSYDISMILLVVCYILVALFTPSVFWFNIPLISITFSLGILISMFCFVFLLSLPISVYNIKSAFDSKSNIWNSYLEICRPFLSMITLFVASTFWAINSHNSIITVQPRMFLYATGTTFSSLICRLIIAQMSRTKCKPFNLSLIPYLICLFISCFANLSELSEVILLSVYTIYITLAHAHFGTCVVLQISKFLNVPVFTTKDYEKTAILIGDRTDKHRSASSSSKSNELK